MTSIFRKLLLKDTDDICCEVPYKISEELITVTPDNNLLFYNESDGMICLWSMESKRIILSEKATSNDVTKVYASKGN